MPIKIDKEVLEKVCEEIIETILMCLPNAYKGTVYRIGKPPELQARRITSGIIDADKKIISWGLPAKSDYNDPGKPWIKYRDQPGHPLEAMAWCVERQKSWTAGNPENDSRSVRLQVDGILDDVYHMEPVLIRKQDLHNNDSKQYDVYPENIYGEQIWKNSDHVVVAVIKIHFKPCILKIDGPESQLIKKLSRTFGTELLSYQLRHQSDEANRKLAEDRKTTCNILADSIRNAIAKTGLIFSLIKLEVGVLRDQWEKILREQSNTKCMKGDTIEALNNIAEGLGNGSDDKHKNDLITAHNRFLEISLPPEQGVTWIYMQIEERWNKWLSKIPHPNEITQDIHRHVDMLKESLHIGRDPEILALCNNIPELLKKEWTELIYKNIDKFDTDFLNALIKILEDPRLILPNQEKSRKTLMHLSALAVTMEHLERNTNDVLRDVMNGAS